MTHLTLEGIVSPEAATAFAENLGGLSSTDTPLTVDLSDAELQDGTATATLVAAVRDAGQRLSSIHVLEPPQVFAHGLYRVGALGHGSTIHLVSPREELGTSS